jgi:hypothetical protein
MMVIKLGKQPLTFGEKIQKTIQKMNKQSEENFNLYAKACVKSGKKIGEPIDIMDLLRK